MRFVSKLSKTMWVSLNAIYLQPEDITHLKEEAANFDHIIEPYLIFILSQKQEWMKSGLKKKNQWLHNCNLETAAFISGDGVKKRTIFCWRNYS